MRSSLLSRSYQFPLRALGVRRAVPADNAVLLRPSVRSWTLVGAFFARQLRGAESISVVEWCASVHMRICR
jgi:hypothetical protein